MNELQRVRKPEDIQLRLQEQLIRYSASMSPSPVPPPQQQQQQQQEEEEDQQLAYLTLSSELIRQHAEQILAHNSDDDDDDDDRPTNHIRSPAAALEQPSEYKTTTSHSAEANTGNNSQQPDIAVDTRIDTHASASTTQEIQSVTLQPDSVQTAEISEPQANQQQDQEQEHKSPPVHGRTKDGVLVLSVKDALNAVEKWASFFQQPIPATPSPASSQSSPRNRPNITQTPSPRSVRSIHSPRSVTTSPRSPSAPKSASPILSCYKRSTAYPFPTAARFPSPKPQPMLHLTPNRTIVDPHPRRMSIGTGPGHVLPWDNNSR